MIYKKPTPETVICTEPEHCIAALTKSGRLVTQVYVSKGNLLWTLARVDLHDMPESISVRFEMEVGRPVVACYLVTRTVLEKIFAACAAMNEREAGLSELDREQLKLVSARYFEIEAAVNGLSHVWAD